MVAVPYSSLKSTECVSAGNLFFFLSKIKGLLTIYETADAAAKLVEISNGNIAGFIFVINLYDLGGHEQLLKRKYKVENLIQFPGH